MIWWMSIVVVGVILLKRDSLCKKIKFELPDTQLTANESSCVKIMCTGHVPYYTHSQVKVLWFKNAEYDSKNYHGTVVYSNDPQRPAHQDFEGGRAQYIGSQEWTMRSCSLEICCLRMNDSGLYAFRYEGGNKFFTKNQTNLTVQENPCKVRFETTAIHLNESDVASFNCSTSSLCHMQPLIEGLPKRVKVTNNKTSTVASTVASFKVDWEDNRRELSCYIPGVNNMCLFHHPNITLNVTYFPRKPVLETSSSVKLGGSLTLTCSAEAVPAPHTYTWFFHTDRKNWTTCSPGWSKETNNNTLHLQPVTRAHHGRYHCSATNTLGRGENSSSQFVEVLFAPYRLVLSVVTVATEGDHIPIVCRVESWPLPSSLNLSWSSATDPSVHHHLIRHASNTTSLNVTLNVSSVSAGNYTCGAQNSQGYNHSVQKLEVHYAPKHVEIIGLSGDEYDADVPVQLRCHSVSFPPVQYKWFKKLNSNPKEKFVSNHQNLTVDPHHPGIYYCFASNVLSGKQSKLVRLFLNRIEWRLNEIFWAIPLVCTMLPVIAYLVCRYKRKKVSDRAPDHLSAHPEVPTGSANACGSRDDLLPNLAPSHTSHTSPYTGHASSCTGHASSHAPQCNAAGQEKLFSSIIDTVYSTVNLPTGTQPIREDHGCAGDEVNYASLHFTSQGLSRGSSPPAVVESDVYAKITTKSYENLDGEDNELGDIELNYSQVTFTAKQRSKKTTR